MKKQLKTGAAMLAALMVSALGLQACGSDDPLALLLGNLDGPSAAEALAAAQNGCTSACDGDIADLTLGVKGPPPPEGDIDDDYDALVSFLGSLFFWGEEEAFIERDALLEDLYPDGYPDGEFTLGPVSGVVSLADACAPGTGTVVITLKDTLEETVMMASAKGLPEGLDWVSGTETYALFLSNCTLDGDILTGVVGSETVSLSGAVTFRFSGESGKDGFEMYTVTGSLTVNPGAVEPAGGEASATIWGYNEPLSFDVLLSSDLETAPPADGGGACYGGTDATSEEACDGIFMSGDDAFWNIWD